MQAPLALTFRVDDRAAVFHPLEAGAKEHERWPSCFAVSALAATLFGGVDTPCTGKPAAGVLRAEIAATFRFLQTIAGGSRAGSMLYFCNALGFCCLMLQFCTFGRCDFPARIQQGTDCCATAMENRRSRRR